jgi:AraC-like DNA-binding protein
MQRFESIITEDPFVSVQAAASRIGYDDPYYFSRIYKKVRFISPSAYIKSVRESTAPEQSSKPDPQILSEQMPAP